MKNLQSDTQALELILNISSLQTYFQKQVEGQLGVHGIGFTEFVVMFHLDKAAGHAMRRIDLAQKIGLSASGVTRLLKPMEKIGLVEKEENPRDARVRLIKLTRSGKKVFRDSKVSVAHSAFALTDTISSKQQETFKKLITLLLPPVG